MYQYQELTPFSTALGSPEASVDPFPDQARSGIGFNRTTYP